MYSDFWSLEENEVKGGRARAVVVPEVRRGSLHIQGGAVNRGLKRFFSLYRPSYLIEAYVWPEKYLLVWAGPLANHPFNYNFIFLSDG